MSCLCYHLKHCQSLQREDRGKGGYRLLGQNDPLLYRYCQAFGFTSHQMHDESNLFWTSWCTHVPTEHMYFRRLNMRCWGNTISILLQEPDKAGILYDQSVSFSQRGAVQENHWAIWLNTKQERQFVSGVWIETLISILNLLISAFLDGISFMHGRIYKHFV